MKKTPQKTIERLILYRRVVQALDEDRQEKVFSHQIAKASGYTPAQIRRDLMVIGYSGSPVHGYNVHALLKSINEFLDLPGSKGVCIVGLGLLGRSILGYFHGRQPRLKIKAAFDVDPAKTDRVIHGTRCYHAGEMDRIIRENDIIVAILTVPAHKARAVADQLVSAGIRGILNYAPTTLDVPPDIYVENRDMIQAVEKVAYYTK